MWWHGTCTCIGYDGMVHAYMKDTTDWYVYMYWIWWRGTFTYVRCVQMAIVLSAYTLMLLHCSLCPSHRSDKDCGRSLCLKFPFLRVDLLSSTHWISVNLLSRHSFLYMYICHSYEISTLAATQVGKICDGMAHLHMYMGTCHCFHFSTLEGTHIGRIEECRLVSIMLSSFCMPQATDTFKIQREKCGCLYLDLQMSVHRFERFMMSETSTGR